MGGLGQQRPQTARASLVLTPVSEEPTETQGPSPCVSHELAAGPAPSSRAEAPRLAAAARWATPPNPAASPTAPAANRLRDPAPSARPAARGPGDASPASLLCSPSSAPLRRVLQAGAGLPGRAAGPGRPRRAGQRLWRVPRPPACCCCPAPPWGRDAISSPALSKRSAYCTGESGLKRKPTGSHPKPVSRRSLRFYEPYVLRVHQEQMLERARGRRGRP